MTCLYLERKTWCWTYFAWKHLCWTVTVHTQKRVWGCCFERPPIKSHVITNGLTNNRDEYHWLYSWILFFKAKKHFWLGFRLNYAACVSGIWASVLSKPVTYSWNEILFFIDIIFCISQHWLHSSVVLVLDILQSIKISFSGKRLYSVRKNHLLVQQNTGHSWDSEKNSHICIDILSRFNVIIFWTLNDIFVFERAPSPTSVLGLEA